jgi:hypothetical protein
VSNDTDEYYVVQDAPIKHVKITVQQIEQLARLEGVCDCGMLREGFHECPACKRPICPWCAKREYGGICASCYLCEEQYE